MGPPLAPLVAGRLHAEKRPTNTPLSPLDGRTYTAKPAEFGIHAASWPAPGRRRSSAAMRSTQL